MKRFIISTLVSGLLLLTGCSDDSTSSSDQQGEIIVYLVDSPWDYDAVNIVVNRVEVHKSDVGGSDSGWVVINDEPATHNLLDLRNGIRAVLGSAKLDPGHYTQIRLILDPGSNVVVDGTAYDLYVPSGYTTGFKFIHAFTIEEDKLYELTFDFEVKQSVFKTGNDRYTLQPTIRVVPNVISGTISGTVEPMEAMPLVWTSYDNDTVFAYPDEDGYFKLMAVPEGTYEVYFDPENTAYASTVITNVAVVAEEDTDLGTVTLEEN